MTRRFKILSFSFAIALFTQARSAWAQAQPSGKGERFFDDSGPALGTPRQPAPSTSHFPATLIARPPDLPGVHLLDKNERIQISLRGQVQLDSQTFIRDEGELNNTFNIRRARMTLLMRLFDFVDINITPSWDEGNAGLVDAFMLFHFMPELQLMAGRFRSPFGLERLRTGANLSFIERGWQSELSHNRDIGVQLLGSIINQSVSYHLAWVDGGTDGSRLSYRPGESKKMVSRIFIQPFHQLQSPWINGLGVGAAFSLGWVDGSADNLLMPQYLSPGRQEVFETRPTTYADGLQRRWNLQGYYYAYRFGLLGEYTSAFQKVSNTQNAHDGLTHQAWNVSATFFLTDDLATFDMPSPKRPLDLSKGQWGAIELAFRWSMLILDENTFPDFADASEVIRGAESFTAGINWYFNPFIKFMVNYAYSDFANGSPDGDRLSEHALGTRLQFRI